MNYMLLQKSESETKNGCGKLEKCVTTAGAETLAQYNSSVIDPVLNGFVNGKFLTAILGP